MLGAVKDQEDGKHNIVEQNRIKSKNNTVFVNGKKKGTLTAQAENGNSKKQFLDPTSIVTTWEIH